MGDSYLSLLLAVDDSDPGRRTSINCISGFFTSARGFHETAHAFSINFMLFSRDALGLTPKVQPPLFSNKIHLSNPNNLIIFTESPSRKKNGFKQSNTRQKPNHTTSFSKDGNPFFFCSLLTLFTLIYINNGSDK